MPNRILRDGLRDSERINDLTDTEFRLFVLLITVCDDFGRYHGDKRLVRSACYPFGEVAPAKVEIGLAALQDKGLLVRYKAADGRIYLQMERWSQRTRAKESKFPASDGQTPVKRPAHAHGDGDGDGDVGGDVGVDERVSQVATDLATSLATGIESWKPDYRELRRDKRRRTIANWSADIDKAVRLDKREPAALHALIEWLPTHEGSDGFRWRDNVLSGRKLRDQYDKLDIAKNRENASGGAVQLGSDGGIT